MNRLREALGDSAEKPRYVETVARRGYRFIALVEGGPKLVEPRREHDSSLPVHPFHGGPKAGIYDVFRSEPDENYREETSDKKRIKEGFYRMLRPDDNVPLWPR